MKTAHAADKEVEDKFGVKTISMKGLSSNRTRATGSRHRAEPSRPSARFGLLGVTHKYVPTCISALFMCATCMLSQSEASNARAGRASMARHPGVTGWGPGGPPSQSGARDVPPSKPNRAPIRPSRAQAEGPLGLLGLIPGLRRGMSEI